MQSYEKRISELILIFCYWSFEMRFTQEHITITIGVFYSQTISTHTSCPTPRTDNGVQLTDGSTLVKMENLQLEGNRER